MDTLTLLITALCVLNLIAVAVALFLWRKNRAAKNNDPVSATLQLMKAELAASQSESLLTIRDSIDRANLRLNEQLAEGNLTLDRRMKVVSDIQNQLGQLSVQAENIESVGKNIQSLSELLKPPKLRGGLGETMLENLLGEILPKALFDTQYGFDDGRRVDAIIRVGERLLPIDAKFPLESFQRLSANSDDKTARRDFTQAMKKHIDDIANRYIKPLEKTTDFALLYLPAERIYYELIGRADQSVFQYALSRKVIPTSPGHLYAFLSTFSAIYSELQLGHSTASAGAKQLSVGLSELKESVARLQKHLDRMQGSAKSMNLSLGKARTESEALDFGVRKIMEPEKVVRPDIELTEECQNLT